MAGTIPLTGAMAQHSQAYLNQRTNDILEVIMSYARLEFSHKTEVTGEGDVFDAISAGVNMLGEELENSVITLREKESLLKEIHHRVKNNLQIISSLLNLQANHTEDQQFLAMIRECRNRIVSMAIIHEMLYMTKDLSRINAADYIVRLSQSIYQSFSLSEGVISFEYAIDEDIYLEADKIIPIGLILNEIVSNSMKYAFPDGCGTVSVIFREEGGGYFLQTKDDGIGIPAGYDYRNSKSLGLQLIYTLSDQLEAELKLESHPGTNYVFRFA